MKYKQYKAAALAAALLLITGFTPMYAQKAKTQKHRGKASFYSKKATGSRTSSGERIHHDSLTCAHRFYPFGTLLKVTNLRNGKSCVVRVNDRGPHSRGRIIDLSYGAANALGMIAQGIAMVEVERVDNTKIPYRDEPAETGLPEFEFDIKDLSNGLVHPFKPEVPRRQSNKEIKDRVKKK